MGRKGWTRRGGFGLLLILELPQGCGMSIPMRVAILGLGRLVWNFSAKASGLPLVCALKMAQILGKK